MTRDQAREMRIVLARLGACRDEKRVAAGAEADAMSDASLTPDRLLKAIETRLQEISGQMHRLARERAFLQEQRTPLSLSILTSEAESVLLRLRASGIRLRGVEAAPRRTRVKGA